MRFTSTSVKGLLSEELGQSPLLPFFDGELAMNRYKIELGIGKATVVKDGVSVTSRDLHFRSGKLKLSSSNGCLKEHDDTHHSLASLCDIVRPMDG